MKALLAGLCGPLALALTFGACRDSSTAVREGAQARAPSFATASDTGGGGGPGNQSHFMSNGDVGSVNWAGDSTATASDTGGGGGGGFTFGSLTRSEDHTSELQSHHDLVCRLLLEKKKKKKTNHIS